MPEQSDGNLSSNTGTGPTVPTIPQVKGAEATLERVQGVKGVKDGVLGRAKDAGGFVAQDTTTTPATTSLPTTAKTVPATKSRIVTVKNPGAKDAGGSTAHDTNTASTTTVTATSLTTTARTVPTTKPGVGTGSGGEQDCEREGEVRRRGYSVSWG
jgi:hypothetical protein